MEKVTITFKDGTKIKAEVNGSCYIVAEKPTFPSDLSEVRIKDVDGERTINNAQIIEAYAVDDNYWFGIAEIPAAQLEKEKTDAQIMYTALITDTLLED